MHLFLWRTFHNLYLREVLKNIILRKYLVMYDVLFQYCKYCYLCSAVCDTICQPGKLYTN